MFWVHLGHTRNVGSFPYDRLPTLSAFPLPGRLRTVLLELTHPMTQTDPTVRPRAIRLVEYLEAVRGLREQPIRDVAEYRDRRWWAGDIPAHPACVVSPTGEEPWLRGSKAQRRPPPEVPALIAPYLVSDVADP